MKNIQEKKERNENGQFIAGHKGIINSGTFKKGHKFSNEIEKKRKTNQLKAVTGENHYNWKNGRGNGTWRRIVERAGKDLSTCQICDDKGKMVIHHIDGNRENNDLWNLLIKYQINFKRDIH